MPQLPAFRARVFATQPTIQFGGMLMHVLAQDGVVRSHHTHHITTTPLTQSGSDAWKQYSCVRADPRFRDCDHWLPMYTHADVDLCLTKVGN